MKLLSIFDNSNPKSTIQEKPIFFIRAVGSGGAGGATAPPIFLDVRKKVAFSTPNYSTLQD